MKYATAFDVGDRKRDDGINEDSVALAVTEDGHRAGTDGDGATRGTVAFALADGAGGHEAGDVASYLASTIVIEELAGRAARWARSDPEAFDIALDAPLPDGPTAVSVQTAVDEAIQMAHRDVLRYATNVDATAMSTVVAGVAVGGELHYGWVGDSRAYVCNAVHETVEQITKDHSIVTELADAGEIDDVEARIHPRANELTNAVGGDPGQSTDGATVAVETHTIPLYADDLVLLTSDGLIDAQTDAPDLHDRYTNGEADAAAVREEVVTDDDIGATVFGSETLDAAAEALIDLGNDRGGKDNLSTLLFRDPTLASTPVETAVPVRAMDPGGPVEDRETVIVPEE